MPDCKGKLQKEFPNQFQLKGSGGTSPITANPGIEIDFNRKKRQVRENAESRESKKV